jgi:hypothetical protein
LRLVVRPLGIIAGELLQQFALAGGGGFGMEPLGAGMAAPDAAISGAFDLDAVGVRA